jgi:predicted nucleic acid-binding Zn ribbon protein
MPSPSRKNSRAKRLILSELLLGSISKKGLGYLTGKQSNRSRKTRILQYFIGLPEFQEKAPFDHFLMTRFRKRLGANIINELNEWIALEEQERQSEEHLRKMTTMMITMMMTIIVVVIINLPVLLRKRIQLDRLLLKRRTKESSFWT